MVRFLIGKIGFQKDFTDATDSQMTDFVPKFQPEGGKCARIVYAHTVWFYLLNILKLN